MRKDKNTLRSAIMRSNIVIIIFLFCTIYSCKTKNNDKDTKKGNIISTGYWIPKYVSEIKYLKGWGPFVRLPDGNILTINGKNCYISNDEAKTWAKEFPIFKDTSKYSITSPVLIQIRSGVIILAFANGKEKANWNWLSDIHDSPGAILPTYAVQSIDGGKTWQNLQKLHSEWTGMIRDIIETKDGNVVFTSMIMRHNPGHHTVLTYTTKDEGKSWIASNIIDLGGIGNHGGVMESTLVQLKDDSLWMLLRTNMGNFWQAFSNCQGITWENIGPTNIDASSSPGLIKRLKSGRLVLVWNRLFMEKEKEYHLRGGDSNLTQLPASFQREELSIMFSDDDGNSWTVPKVIAKAHNDTKKWLAYPYIFEAKPGELWITTLQCDLRIKLNEKDFIGRK